MRAYCGAYVGTPLLFSEMPECGAEFDADLEDRELPFWTTCPECGAEVEVGA